MAGGARRAGDQGIVGGRLSHRRQSGIARVHRPGRAGFDPQTEDRGPGLRGCRQGPRCADCPEIAGSMASAENALTPDRQRAELAALSAPAVLFTLAMIAFPVVYTVWLGFHSFS